MKNTIICIGYTGIMRCYLNVSVREAMMRYAESEGITESEVRNDKDIQINSIHFDDEFCAYSIWEGF